MNARQRRGDRRRQNHYAAQFSKMAESAQTAAAAFQKMAEVAYLIRPAGWRIPLPAKAFEQFAKTL